MTRSTTLAEQQVAEAEVDDDDVLLCVRRAVLLDEEPGRRHLAQRLGNWSEALLMASRWST